MNQYRGWLPLAVVVIGIIVVFSAVTIVPAGHVGVVDLFGWVRPVALSPGVAIVVPMSRVHRLSVRTQEMKEAMAVPTSEGLIARLEISALYHLNPERAVEVYKRVGTVYPTVVVVPGLRNSVRDVVAEFKSEALYSEERRDVSNRVEELLSEFYNGYGVTLERVLFRDLVLPEQVTQAIERKLGADQEQQAMQFVLAKERQVAEQKRIEAGGIADAQKIIAKGLTKEYLTWRYITTLESLGKSPNSTFIMTPYDQALIPLLNVPK
ncbi:prohibitin family protein [candidate division KSB1 bacterium]